MGGDNRYDYFNCCYFNCGITFLIMRNFSKNKFFKKLKEKINNKIKLDIDSKNQIKYIILCTLNPFLPQSLINYAFGLTSIKFKDFFYHYYICIISFEFFYVILVQALRL